MKFLKHGISINEAKFSTLMLSFIVTIGFVLYKYAKEGTVDGGVLTLVAYQIGAITGINIADRIKGNSDTEE